MSSNFTFEGDAPIRLNKWMASLGICSRREAETLISQGSISVEGQKVTEPGHKIEPGQTMTLAGKDGIVSFLLQRGADPNCQDNGRYLVTLGLQLAGFAFAARVTWFSR